MLGVPVDVEVEPVRDPPPVDVPPLPVVPPLVCASVVTRTRRPAATARRMELGIMCSFKADPGEGLLRSSIAYGTPFLCKLSKQMSCVLPKKYVPIVQQITRPTFRPASSSMS